MDANRRMISRLHDERARLSAQLDTIKRAGPGAWLQKCIRQLDATMSHTCLHEWQHYREEGPYGERYKVCTRCGQPSYRRRNPIPDANLLPEIKRLLRPEGATPCTTHLFHESSQARMTREALRLITDDNDTTAVATCLCCNQRNDAYSTREASEPQPTIARADQATQTEASGLLCRDEVPDEATIENTVEEVMDTLAGTPHGNGCATFLPHDGPWSEDDQRWHDGSPICRTCQDSSYPEPCALIFAASTRTRSVAVYADQCQGCRGLYDGIRGLKNGFSQPEDIYSGHPLPLGASDWTQESDIVAPLMEPGVAWERPTFRHGRLCFPDGRAAELAAATALTASAMAYKTVIAMQQELYPCIHVAATAAAVATIAASEAAAVASKAMASAIASQPHSAAATAAMAAAQVAQESATMTSAASSYSEDAQHYARSLGADAWNSWAIAQLGAPGDTDAATPTMAHSPSANPLTPVNEGNAGDRNPPVARMARITTIHQCDYNATPTPPPTRARWLDEARSVPARCLMTATVRGLLQHIHAAKSVVDRVHNHRRPRAVPASITRMIPGDPTTPENHPARLPWLDVEAVLIERRLAFAAPSYADYQHWTTGTALCDNPVCEGQIPTGELVAHLAEVSYLSASVAFHHNSQTRSAWLGCEPPHGLRSMTATPPAPLGLPLDQGPTERTVAQGFYLLIDHLTGIPGRWATLCNSSEANTGSPVNSTTLRETMTALPPATRSSAESCTMIRTTHILLQGLERRADWQEACPIPSCPKAAEHCPHAVCPGLNCRLRRAHCPSGYLSCGDPSCTTYNHVPRTRSNACDWEDEADFLYCFESFDTLFADDTGPTLLSLEEELGHCPPPTASSGHGASTQATANELARLSPIEDRIKSEGTLPTCRMGHKRLRTTPGTRTNKRHRGPVVRRGSFTPVMMGQLTIVMGKRRVATKAWIDTGANVSILSQDFSSPTAQQGEQDCELITVSGATVDLGKIRLMRIAVSQSKTITIRGHAETASTPLENCSCLLGMDAILTLGIDLNALTYADNKGGPAVIKFLDTQKAHTQSSAHVKVFDMFCGIGGATLGMEQAGWRTIGMIDSDSSCVNVCKAAFPYAAVYLNDATTPALAATLRQLKPDVVWSSPPCQPASTLNLYKRPQDSRAAAGVRACQQAITANPALIIIENVPAYARTPAYAHTVRLLQNSAYHVETNYINAARCGLPQSRKRLIITGFRGNEPLGLREAIATLRQTPDTTIKSLIPRARHIFFPPRLSRKQPYVISAMDKCPCITTKCLGRPGKKLRPCAANSADISKATILTARDFALLQGIPKKHPLPYNHQAVAGRLIGNAFPPICAEHIANAVSPALHRYLRATAHKEQPEEDVPRAYIRRGCAQQWKDWSHVRNILELREHAPYNDTCRLSEKVLRQYLKKHGDDATASILTTYSIRDMDINPDVDDTVKQKVHRLCEKYPDIWLKNSQQLPRPVLGQDGKPFIHRIVFKDNHKPTRCRQPEFPIGSAKRTLLEAWTEQGLKSGLLVKAENSLWASRVLTVAKYNLDENRDGVPDNLRIVSDFVQANTQKKPVVPEFAHAHIEMHRVSGYRWYAQLDAAKGYWGFLLDKASSASTAIWLPHNGRTALFRYTRAVMGDQSAGATMNTRFAEALALNVDERARKHLSNMADDWVAFANTIEELLYALDALFKMFNKFQITVNPAKVRLFYNTVTYWGFDFSANGSKPSARNLNPVRKMQIPTTRKELQAALGLFNYFSHYIHDMDKSRNPPRRVTYSELIAPMQQLVRGPPRTTKQFAAAWLTPQQKSFDRIREILLSGIMLHAPDYTRPFRMSSDASDHGWGATLFQDKPTPGDTSPPDPEAPPGVPEPSKVNIIRMWSKAWSESQRKLPVYFRESLGWALGIRKCRPYVLSSRFPLITQTDHLPLTWIRKSSGKAAISTFLTSQIADVDWRIFYLPGHLNTLADAVSRPPFLGPLRPSTAGLHEMVKTLLGHLPATKKDCKHPHVYAGKDTARLARQLQAWRTGRNPIKKFSCSPSNVAAQTWDLSIVVPIAETAGTIAHRMLKKGLPVACLLPTSLLHRVSQNMDGTYDKLVTQRVANSGKICFASGEYMWLIHDDAHPAVHRVYRAVAHCRTASKITPPQPSATDIGDTGTWSYTLSPAEATAAKKAGLTLLSKEKGPQYVSNTDDPAVRIVVPPDKRIALIDLTHKQSHHLGWKMNWDQLKPSFWWPTMRKDIEDRVSKCAPCKLAKGTRRFAHTYWRARPESAPRTSWSFDFKGMPTSSNGSNEIAGAIDFATHKLILIPLPNRKADVTAEAIMTHICYREGTPLVFHSDSAAELLSRIMTELWKLQGTKATQTLGHNPTGNSLVERSWRFVNAALRCLTDAQYKNWHRYLPAIAAAWNSTPRRTLGVSPFEASCGMPLRTPPLAIAEKRPTRPRSMNKTEITMLHEAAASFRALASKTDQWNRERVAKLKNNEGRWKHKFKLGDLVKIFIPPTAKEAKRRGRKAKHCYWYRGPASIVKILSDTTYTVQIHKTRRLFDRSIVNISPWGPAHPADKDPSPVANTPPQKHGGPTNEAAPASTDVYNKGDIIAVKDDSSDDTYWLADVQRIKGDDLTLAYYGTRGRNIRTACFRPLLSTKKNQLTFKKEKGAKRWTGQMYVHNLPGCVMARNLNLTKGGTLSKASSQVLTSLVNTLTHALVDKPSQ